MAIWAIGRIHFWQKLLYGVYNGPNVTCHSNVLILLLLLLFAIGPTTLGLFLTALCIDSIVLPFQCHMATMTGKHVRSFIHYCSLWCFLIRMLITQSGWKLQAEVPTNPTLGSLSERPNFGKLESILTSLTVSKQVTLPKAASKHNHE